MANEIDCTTGYKPIWLSDSHKVYVDQIVDMVVETSKSEPFIGVSSEPSQSDIHMLRGRLIQGLSSDRSGVLAVLWGSTIVGAVCMNRSATANQAHIAELTTGVVDKAHRKRGVVAVAFRGIVDRCSEEGIDILRLDVREGTDSERIWRRFGFMEYGRLEDYGRCNEERYTGVYLAQSVRSLNSILSTQIR
ncbi:GNAT family N-acetyltransferase [Nocardia camponoti]|uniref:N-acetyltransferase domain-containing protein n=1 Tax=Nocardia camponoti TaxID=1616106 RepID=A0A917Q7U0_9NOCA|nr:GNAT family N-acetyltransferase [Nocardia camponoti]GGK34293.1 hypothetical protein GCM10011591_02510 [Nocardia camponoti]